MPNYEITIKSNKKIFDFNWREIWDYRELLFVFVWRDLKVRYRQTLLGVFWVVFQPLATTGVFSIFFGKIARLPSDGLPYPLFVLIGLAFWNFFANGVTYASNSLINNQNLIKKIYFPRAILPLSSVLISFLDFFIILIVLVIAVIFYGFIPSPLTLGILPLLILITVLAMAGIGMVVAAVNIRYRDMRFVLTFLLQLGLFASPVIFPVSAVYDYRRFLLSLNPLTAVIETARGLIRNVPPDYGLLFLGLVIALIVFVSGYIYFKNTEYYLADEL